jgi:biopolymer transport protein ExbD
MAFGGVGGKGAVRAEINITPLVDVVLVLLIIFMVMTPILLKELGVQVPEKVDVRAEVPPGEQVVLGVAADGALTLDRAPLPRDQLAPRIRALMSARREKVVFFDVAEAANYGEVVGVMDECRGAGAEVLGIVTR